MLLVSDVHGATAALRRVAALGEPLLVLGDLINLIDYRTNDGIVKSITGAEFTDEYVDRRTAGDVAGARSMWREFSADYTDEALRDLWSDHVEAAYKDVCPALEGAEAYVTFGNVDRPDRLEANLPGSAKYVDVGVIELEGRSIGIAGGGVMTVNTPGEITDEEMEAKLAPLAGVDVLCTHVAPSIDVLAQDVIGGRAKGSSAVLSFVERHQPSYHFFGDVHQPRALTWRIGATRCHNVGYFRATGRPFRFTG